MAPPIKEEIKKKSHLSDQIKNVMKERLSYENKLKKLYNTNKFDQPKVKTDHKSSTSKKYCDAQNKIPIIVDDAPRPSSSKENQNEERYVYDINGQDVSSSGAESESENDEVEDEVVFEQNVEDMSEETQSEQLYGKDYKNEKMICIGHDIYCKKRILHMTLGSSHRQTHIARKLIEGVFKTESLQHCTFSGLPARAQGKERQQLDVEPLAFRARTAIIEYSIAIGKQRKWKTVKPQIIERAMSQKLGEIKRRLIDELNNMQKN